MIMQSIVETINEAYSDLNVRTETPIADTTSDMHNAFRQVRDAFAQHIRHLANAASSDPFGFVAWIPYDEGKALYHKVDAKLDTQSDDNWVSSDLISRIGAHESTVPWEDDRLRYVSFGGYHFKPAGTVELTWTQDKARMRTNRFLVNTEGPFDMILGKNFIIEEGPSVLSRRVLATRLAPLSAGTSASAGLSVFQES